MDQRKYTTLVEALAEVPDPRKRRGQRYPWIFLLTLVSAALASGQQHGRAIGQWVQEHAATLRQVLDWRGRALPSEATLRRVLRRIDVAALEGGALWAGASSASHDPQHPRHRSGRASRWTARSCGGCGRTGASCTWSAWSGTTGTQRVPRWPRRRSRTNRMRSRPRPARGGAPLRGRDLRGQVVTVDALLAQQALARQIRQQHGHYLMVIKENQPEAYPAIALLFAEPPEGVTAAESVVRTINKGHGRLEWRTLEASAALADWLRWPGGRQVLRRTCRRVIVATGEVSEEVTYGITSLSAQQANAAVLERLWRGHWTIENRVHYPRDVTLGEDAGQAYRRVPFGRAPGLGGAAQCTPATVSGARLDKHRRCDSPLWRLGQPSARSRRSRPSLTLT